MVVFVFVSFGCRFSSVGQSGGYISFLLIRFMRWKEFVKRWMVKRWKVDGRESGG